MWECSCSHQALRSRPRPSAFADALVVERASLGTPTLSGYQLWRVATADRTSASSVESVSSNPGKRSDGRPASLREALRAGVLEFCACPESFLRHPRSTGRATPPSSWTLAPLLLAPPNQPPEFLLINNPDVQGTRSLQLAPSLITR